MSIRERDNLFQIWNTNSELHEKSTVIQKVKELLASIQFLTVFYTGKYAEILPSVITHRLVMLVIIIVIVKVAVYSGELAVCGGDYKVRKWFHTKDWFDSSSGKLSCQK